MVAPQDRELVRERVQQILAGEDILPIEHRIIRKDGEIRWISDTTILFKDATGSLLSYDGVIKDITERKQADDKLRNQRDLLALQKEELETTLARVRQLEGIIPICSYCKKIRDDKQSWQQLEKYITEHSEALFSHAMCPECYEEQMKLISRLHHDKG
jgi:glucose-6-phosphate 1-dehydrogenase